jgi:hypothetical protein
MVEGVNCNTCDRSFSSAFSLAQHLRDSPVHAPTFDCDNRTFSSASLLAQHLRHSPVHAPSSDGKALEIGLGNLNLTDQVRFHHTSSAQESNEHPPQSSSVSPAGTGSELSSDDSLDDVDDSDHVYAEPDFDLIEQLIPERGNTTERDGSIDTVDRDIGHAPLISGSIVQEHSKDAIPQYGLFGRVMAEDHDTKMFHNTNVPFSTFICGVQGSGKSHSTACMLENALIPSPQLGHLRAPVSALVFSYGEFSNGGSDFSLSEAAFLAATDKAVATSGVRKVTVLTSPSNPAIKKHYQKIPGIEILPFKLKAKSLDIAALLTLMAVNEKSEVPLYMAKVQSILRTIATENETGVFDYDLFKKRIALENFDPKQTNMLEMRLDLLEFFLDKEGNVPEPQFRPGEITIIDLSDPLRCAQHRVHSLQAWIRALHAVPRTSQDGGS